MYHAGGWWPSGRGLWQSESCWWVAFRAGLAERIILAAKCILLVGGDRLDVAGGRAYHAASGLEYPSESCKKRPSDSSEAAIRGK